MVKPSKVVSPPKVILPEALLAFFKVKEHGYAVSLSNCQCDYFQKQNKPCRHIYRLARELGIKTPAINSIINIAELITGKDFYAEGRTIERLGLSGLSVSM